MRSGSGRTTTIPCTSLLLLVVLLLPGTIRGQLRLAPDYHLVPDDVAVLAGDEDRKDLPCKVSVVKPEMGFDLRFHTGYTINLPLKPLAGSDNQLRVLFRVTPLASDGEPYTLISHIPVPFIDPSSGGETQIPGEYAVGPGGYHIDWLMRDRAERVCSAHWSIEAKLDDAYQSVSLPIQPDTVEASPEDGFGELLPIERDREHPLHLKVLINFSPGDPEQAALKREEQRAITSIVRAIARESSFGLFSVVAFSMDEENIFYRQHEAPRIDFPALGKAVEQLKFGTVDYSRLQDPDSATNFLSTILTGQLGPQAPAPDAIVIISPKVMLDKNPQQDELAQAGTAECPVFYMNYNADPRGNPWSDAISNALKVYRGVEYSISAPRDLGKAVGEMMSLLKK